MTKILCNAMHNFLDMAEYTGANAVASKILRFNIAQELRKEVEGSITDSLTYLVVVGVILMIMGIILGNLEAPLSAAIPDNSSFVGLKTSIPANLTSAMNIAVIIPIIMAAMLILGVVYMIANRG